jgi:hypothetical protein
VTVVDLLGRLRARRIELVAEGTSLRVRAPEGALTPDLRDALTSCKAEILAFLNGSVPGGHARIAPVSRATELPLSYAQERFWFLEQLVPGTSANHIAFGIRFSGSLDLTALRASLQEIVNRHEVLRSTVSAEGGRARLAIAPAGVLQVPLHDLRSLRQRVRRA